MLRAMITDVVLKGVQKHQCSPPSAALSSRLPSIASLPLPLLGTYPGGKLSLALDLAQSSGNMSSGEIKFPQTAQL